MIYKYLCQCSAKIKADQLSLQSLNRKKTLHRKTGSLPTLLI